MKLPEIEVLGTTYQVDWWDILGLLLIGLVIVVFAIGSAVR